MAYRKADTSWKKELRIQVFQIMGQRVFHCRICNGHAVHQSLNSSTNMKKSDEVASFNNTESSCTAR
jgi:hypothetical protein